MNRSFGYWFEKLIGYLTGALFALIAYTYYSHFEFISNTAFLDKAISISSTLFGFMLAILTLILQGNSPTVNAMKVHGSYTRLVNFNKNTVIAAILNCVLSLILSFCGNELDSISLGLFKIITIINFAIFVCVIINTLLFTMFFYRIVISDQ